MRKIAIYTKVLQEKPGKYGGKIRRLNPWNPLSYILIIMTFLVGFVLYGFVGIWKELDFRNPFKYS